MVNLMWLAAGRLPCLHQHESSIARFANDPLFDAHLLTLIAQHFAPLCAKLVTDQPFGAPYALLQINPLCPHWVTSLNEATPALIRYHFATGEEAMSFQPNPDLPPSYSHGIFFHPHEPEVWGIAVDQSAHPTDQLRIYRHQTMVACRDIPKLIHPMHVPRVHPVTLDIILLDGQHVRGYDWEAKQVWWFTAASSSEASSLVVHPRQPWVLIHGPNVNVYRIPSGLWVREFVWKDLDSCWGVDQLGSECFILRTPRQLILVSWRGKKLATMDRWTCPNVGFIIHYTGWKRIFNGYPNSTLVQLTYDVNKLMQ